MPQQMALAWIRVGSTANRSAEIYDVVVELRLEAYCLFAESMDRSDYAAGPLAVRPRLSAGVPARRERPLRTMTDMGMVAHVGMGHGDISAGPLPAGGVK